MNLPPIRRQVVVPAADTAEYVRRAQDEDQSVVRGVLLVRVRPWHVIFTGQM